MVERAVPPQPPPSLSYVSQFLKRFTELQTVEPVISYYCLFYAVKYSLDCVNRAKSGVCPGEAKTFVNSLFGFLEQTKASLALPGDEQEAKNLIVSYAFVLFKRAVQDEQSQQVTRSTAKMYLVAANVFESLRGFGELEGETEKYVKLCKLKAAETARLLKGGGACTPSDGHELAAEEQSPTSQPPAESEPVDEVARRVSVIQETLKFTRYATSALQFEDIPTAKSNLETALALLQNLK